MVDKVRLVHPLKSMPLAYAFVNLVVSASIEPEAFGRVSIEAQAMKKPILASAIGGSVETVLDKKQVGYLNQIIPRILPIIFTTFQKWKNQCLRQLVMKEEIMSLKTILKIQCV